eukprot:SAG31_NODE_2362_length_5864_cov_5.175195_2_plen_252_part_00
MIQHRCRPRRPIFNKCGHTVRSHPSQDDCYRTTPSTCRRQRSRRSSSSRRRSRRSTGGRSRMHCSELSPRKSVFITSPPTRRHRTKEHTSEHIATMAPIAVREGQGRTPQATSTRVAKGCDHATPARCSVPKTGPSHELGVHFIDHELRRSPTHPPLALLACTPCGRIGGSRTVHGETSTRTLAPVRTSQPKLARRRGEGPASRERPKPHMARGLAQIAEGVCGGLGRPYQSRMPVCLLPCPYDCSFIRVT